MSVPIPNSQMQLEIKSALNSDDKLLGEVFRLRESGITSALELAEKSGASGRAVIYHNIHILNSLFDGQLPSGAAVSRFAVQAIDRLSKNSQFSKGTLEHLQILKNMLRDNAEKISALKADQQELEERSDVLARKAEDFSHAIYVYSYPTYIYFGTVDDPELMWLKIGSTTNNVWKRIMEQSRQTAMPEDPKLLRIYHSPNMDVHEIEKTCDDSLDSFGHSRSSTSQPRAGKEWFATSLAAVDQLAKVLKLNIESEVVFFDLE